MKLYYDWSLKDAVFTKDKGTVFSCFAGGGGSSMGYKLAGFDVIGCNEIDPKMNEVYVKNLNPKYNYLQGIIEFKNRNDLPDELYNLDILDGSPPCTSFSVAGNREADWGKEKKFSEGGVKQVLDTLFFDFIDLANKLQPKIVIAENVKGLLLGRAKEYVRRIYKEFDLAGYHVQDFLLDASKMGVPQKRERVFFIAVRKDLAEVVSEYIDLFNNGPNLRLKFKEQKIYFGKIMDGLGKDLTEHQRQAWDKRSVLDSKLHQSKERANMKPTTFNTNYAFDNKVLRTLIPGFSNCILFQKPVCISQKEFIKASTFPSDYDFCNTDPSYVMGMSVPPLMTARIATEVYNQWLVKINRV